MMPSSLASALAAVSMPMPLEEAGGSSLPKAQQQRPSVDTQKRYVVTPPALLCAYTGRPQAVCGNSLYSPAMSDKAGDIANSRGGLRAGTAAAGSFSVPAPSAFSASTPSSFARARSFAASSRCAFSLASSSAERPASLPGWPPCAMSCARARARFSRSSPSFASSAARRASASCLAASAAAAPLPDVPPSVPGPTASSVPMRARASAAALPAAVTCAATAAAPRSTSWAADSIWASAPVTAARASPSVFSAFSTMAWSCRWNSAWCSLPASSAASPALTCSSTAARAAPSSATRPSTSFSAAFVTSRRLSSSNCSPPSTHSPARGCCSSCASLPLSEAPSGSPFSDASSSCGSDRSNSGVSPLRARAARGKGDRERRFLAERARLPSVCLRDSSLSSCVAPRRRALISKGRML
mmetsp:Transcript_75836/g.201485  ORF Transcript_75836/g.201485 Transcript_75836/m.201485 type:complete len:414 (+) Transcript_75836:308-1549(+)